MVFYFICYPRGDKSKIAVIDLDYCMDYERDEWSTVNKINYDVRDDAIRQARYLAKKYDLKYEMFESRYDSNMDEYLGEFE